MKSMFLVKKERENHGNWREILDRRENKGKVG